MRVYKTFCGFNSADTLDLPKPESETIDVVAEPSKVQRRMIKNLEKRASKIRTGSVDPREDNMLCVTNDGRKIGLDQRLMDPGLPDEPGSKVNLCVRNVYDIFEQTKAQRSTQLIFCDLSTPKPESRQDCFYVFRKNLRKSLGYEVIRKKVGIKPDFGFDDVKKHIKENVQEESDKLKNGDIVVIRRPSEDMETIISEAAVYTDGVLIPDNSRLEDLEMSEIQEMPPKGFNVYDDIKEKLIAKGVPEDEIAFIHDYDTAEKKQKLFDKMNAGDVRILLGSTSKCGAGMNAQAKMIALHHLDCPLRPSDLGHTVQYVKYV